MTTNTIPLIDVSALIDILPLDGVSQQVDVEEVMESPDVRSVGSQIDSACRLHGFFTIGGHGVDPELRQRLEELSREFFALPEDEKAQISMARGGRAWRGWFPVGHELTSGVPDAKEGIYFGSELSSDDPRVRAGKLLHGPNLWPQRPVELREVVAEWIAVMSGLAARVLCAMAVGLGIGPDYFATGLIADPTLLFRIFHYPLAHAVENQWGVGEHTDYGLLTLLAQDDSGGLQVRDGSGWIDVPADPRLLVCNIGDMLDRITGGRYRSTPHRVLASPEKDRVSFPFFFDPGWDAEVHPIHLSGDTPADDALQRWDRTSLRDLSGTYGDYLSSKVAKVFPGLEGR